MKTKLTFRHLIIAVIFIIAIAALVYRLVNLDLTKHEFLKQQAHHQSWHPKTLFAHRGMILDRHLKPLAVSAPIDNIVIDPKTLMAHPEAIDAIADIKSLNITPQQLNQLVIKHPKLRFYYLKKKVPPALSQAILNLKIPGVSLEHFERSYYPEQNAAAQLVGFTNTHNLGQDALELGYNSWLLGHNGKEVALYNGHGQTISYPKKPTQPENGRNVVLSMDSLIQYTAYSALQKEVTRVHAKSGSVVVIDPNNGEVLAATSYPSFNPNDIKDRVGSQVRNRAITDTYEPGSTMKAFTIGAGLSTGKYTPTTPINTNPGFIKIQNHRIKDDRNFGLIDTTGVLEKSSNVGATKIALSIPRKTLYQLIQNAGFGDSPGGFFPGTATGYLPPLASLGKLSYATLSFGYALSSSTLQLARAYAAIASGGILYPVSFIKLTKPPQGQRIMSQKVAEQLGQMLKTVVSPEGSGLIANIPGYQVVGKTGTTHQVGPHGFYKNHYNSIFAGYVPLKHPKLVIVVRINDPQNGRYNYFGGVSAAPIFATIAQTLRTSGVPPTVDHINQNFFKNQAQWAKLVSKA